jgi:ribonuclease P protein component
MPLFSLRARKDFLKARHGSYFSTKNFKTSALTNTPPTKAKNGLQGFHLYVGYTVTKKQFKRAVDRNRCKRRLRALMRQLAQEYDQQKKSGTLILTLLAREPLLTSSWQKLEQEKEALKIFLDQLLQQK